MIFFVFVLGCGSSRNVLPTTELTDEQKAAIKADDERVANEESQGKNPANNKKKKKL
jgi:hypothetical protein